MADKTYSEDEQNALRASVRGIMETEGISQKGASDVSGVAYGTLNLWLNAKYEGDNDRVAAQIETWLASRKENRRTATLVPAVPGFIETRTAADFTEALRFAQVLPEISVIVGVPGVGKTMTAQHYAKKNPNVWLATMNPATAGVNNMLVELADAMRLVERSAARLPGAIRHHVVGTAGLIIVDEAQHLTGPALDMLRSVYDRCGVGIALVGNETVLARLQGCGRGNANFAQIYSRVGVRVSRAGPRVADVDALLAAWGVSGADERKFLHQLAKKPGALRGVTKCLQLASMLAAGAGEPRAMKHLAAAWSRLTTDTEAA
ncbi:MAG: AAA family ATPase [Alphaproteobacteria bacterium]